MGDIAAAYLLGAVASLIGESEMGWCLIGGCYVLIGRSTGVHLWQLFRLVRG